MLEKQIPCGNDSKKGKGGSILPVGIECVRRDRKMQRFFASLRMTDSCNGLMQRSFALRRMTAKKADIPDTKGKTF